MKKLFLLMVAINVLLAGCMDNDPIADPENNEIEEVTEQLENKEGLGERKEEQDEMLQEDIEEAALIPANVVRVVDGDTIIVKLENGQEERVRLLLVDTPESVHPDKPVQPFGPESSQLAKDWMPTGEKVGLELDVSERDKYGRLLAYVWVGEKMFNELLLEKGLARVAYVFAPNTKHVDRFYEIQKKTQQQAIGIWSIEDYATDRGFDESVVEGETSPGKQLSCENPTIKGNQSSSGELIYHMLC